MYHKLLTAVEGTKKMKQDMSISLARLHAEFWGITSRHKAAFRTKDIKKTETYQPRLVRKPKSRYQQPATTDVQR